MLLRLFLILALVPIAETWLILAAYRAVAERFGTATGAAFTLASILLPGFAGAAVVRSQGSKAIAGLRQALARGEFPDRPLLDTAWIVAGGAMLLAPGYISDVVGLTLLIPWTRGLYRRGLAAWLRRQAGRGRASVSVRHVEAPGDAPARGPGGGDVVIDVTPEE
jgi:UPF0716 protein FxsA